ncbi:flagellar motor switch phosphatase FliY [Planococcus sp. 107-1]|uniref:flagellar motor switch phosphatase FliY n=1 Tax=Planococcus sp. 107-1 TaxID=2908840 RepID=UPI001F2EDB39|nr:flagellar motor switch phosphatase FliY [Planococcus sp. 107-1]UJF27113.1 flagellar motor switch phosphatase FliY [Planococcus sp. 107-1]
MTTEKLSPDEINGLLGQGAEGKPMSTNTLLQVEKEALTELLTVSLGGSSTVLSTLFSEQAKVSTPTISIKRKDDLLSATAAPFFVVLGEYTGGAEGIQILSVNKNDVHMLAKAMDAETEAEDMEKQFQMLQEMITAMFASVTQSMEAVLEQDISYSLSGMDVVEKQKDFPVSKFTQEEWFVEAGFQVKVGSLNKADFHLCIPVQLAKQLVGILTNDIQEEYVEEPQQMQFESNNQTQSTSKLRRTNEEPNIQSVQFSSFDETASVQSEPNNLNMLLDIPLQVTVELGRTKRMVKEILSVSHGSIIELDKLAGEPVDILINNKLIAVGEVVVIDENFGVRVTDILSTADRISKLR